MIPELGKYAASVLSAYGASLGLLAVLVWASWRRGRKMRDELNIVEERTLAASRREGSDIHG